MQLFRVGLTDAAAGRALSAVVPIGWRYLLSDGDAAADVRMDSPDDEPKFGSLISGRLPERLAEAITLAHTMYDHQSGRLVARILEIPAIYRTALWLHGPFDVFFPVMESAARDENPVARDDRFLARIQEEARREIAASEGGDALAG
jgi:hypothetical protein